jgi:hypothetical protein
MDTLTHNKMIPFVSWNNFGLQNENRTFGYRDSKFLFHYDEFTDPYYNSEYEGSYDFTTDEYENLPNSEEESINQMFVNKAKPKRRKSERAKHRKKKLAEKRKSIRQGIYWSARKWEK